jgi:site-specific DNA-methyltransferase (cytosine-N4-specific)
VSTNLDSTPISFSVAGWVAANPQLNSVYATDLGVALEGRSEEVLSGSSFEQLKGNVQLVFTSPPFPLNRKKRYGNLEGRAFKRWLQGYAGLLRDVLTPDGSIVIEMGNAWESRIPVMSTLAMETLLEFKKAAKLHLCQEFIWYNPAKLPTPAAWVTVRRIRVKDAFTRLWWLSPTPYPKADNKRVLTPYSGSMRSLLRNRKYNSGKRPSEHNIGETSFFHDNGGAIPPNVLAESEEHVNNLLVGSNTGSSDPYQQYCKQQNITPHPARMPSSLAKFFVNLCTEAGDIVLDPFGGSNTTGAAAEELGRRWISVEANPEYARAGLGRFPTAASRSIPTPIE